MKNNNNYYKDIEEKILNIQLITTFLFVISLFISISLTYDEKEKLKNNNGLFSNKTSQNLALFNRIFVVILAIVFIYCNYVSKKIAEYKSNETKYIELQIIAGLLSLVASLIVLYVVYKNRNDSNFDIAETENPTL